MPRVIMKMDGQQSNDEILQEGLSTIASNVEAMQFVKTMLNLMKSGDLGFWLSTRMARKIKALGQEQQRRDSQSIGEIDEESFISFLQQGGSLEPNVRWEVESLPNNGGIYRILLKEGKNEGVHNNQG
jgi:hypothetical protein